MDTITKVKSEGRVAAGKRLVEWNRKQKENLLKNKEQVESSGDSSVLSRDAGNQQEPQSRASTVVYGGGAIACTHFRGRGAISVHSTRNACDAFNACNAFNISQSFNSR